MSEKRRRKTDGSIGTTEEETEKLRSGELDRVVIEKPNGHNYTIEDASDD